MKKKLLIVAAVLVLVLSSGVVVHAGGGSGIGIPPGGWSITLPPCDCGYCDNEL